MLTRRPQHDYTGRAVKPASFSLAPARREGPRPPK